MTVLSLPTKLFLFSLPEVEKDCLFLPISWRYLEEKVLFLFLPPYFL